MEKVAQNAPPPGYGTADPGAYPPGMAAQGGYPQAPYMAQMHTATVVAPASTTVVVTQQQAVSQPYPQQMQAWNETLCGCCSDMGVCLCGLCCGPCLACTVAQHMGEHCCAGFLGGVFPMRVKLRTMFGITGSIVDDCITTACCGPCALCQMERELKSRGMC